MINILVPRVLQKAAFVGAVCACVQIPALAEKVELQNPTATISQVSGWNVSLITDGVTNESAGWAVYDFSRAGAFSATAAVETVAEVGFVGGSRLTFALYHVNHNPQHGLGRFRLSYTTDPRESFANGANSGGDVDANWTILNPISAVGTAGETMTIQSDGSVLVSGPNPLKTIYTVTAEVDAQGITGFRIEALEDPSLPASGPGRYPSNGNFVLTEFTADIAPLHDGPPPPPAYNLSSGFSTASNPAGPWQYGWKTTLDGPLSLLQFGKSFGAENGVPLFCWQLSDSQGPGVCKVIGPGVAVSASGQFVAPAGTVYLSPGINGAPENFGVARFTMPSGTGGQYQIETAVADVFDGSFQGDTDFHVLKNGAELFGEFLAPHTKVGYTNVVTLAEGDTVDFVVGRGQDANQTGSLLKVFARLTAVPLPPTNPPEIRSQPSSVAAVLGQDVNFSVNVVGALPLTYQWYYGDTTLAGGTNRTLSLANVGFGDAGAYQVVVTNAFGAVTSSVAALTVNYPAARVQVVSVDSLALGPVQVPVQLVANGNENALAFSLNYDAARLSFVSAELGAGAAGGTLLVNDSTLADGRVGLSVALPAGATFATGTQTVAVVTFTAGDVPSVQRLPVQFGDEPVLRQLSDATAGTLAAVYTGGSISVSPTAVRAGTVETVTGGLASLPVSLQALGTENAVSFSLGYNTALLAFSGVQAGADLPPDASILVNTSQAASGQVGISVALPAGTAFPRGVRDILQANFDVATVLQPVTTPVRFVDSPTVRQVANVNAQSVPATYGTGIVSVVSVALEADIAPRPSGDQALTVIDWVQAGRFAAALDMVEPGEFQRVDCAPREGRGNGVISVADWVQAGRYSAGLDPITGIGGPTEPALAPAAIGGGGGGGNSDCVVRISNTNVLPGSTVNVAVQVSASGAENALGFSLVYDATKLRFVGATKLGTIGAATLNVNTNQASAGRVGMAFALPTGNVLTAGNHDVLLVTLAAASSVSGSTTVTFGDTPVVREAVSATARTVSSSFTSGEIVLGPPLVVGPPMSIVRSSESVVIFWPAAEAGYELQASEAPRGQAWSNVSATPIEIGGQKIVTLPRTGSQKYFRLRKP